MTLRYNKGLGPDEKRRTADSFVVINKPSVSPETDRSNRLVNFTAVDWSVGEMQAIKIVTQAIKIVTTNCEPCFTNLAVISCKLTV